MGIEHYWAKQEQRWYDQYIQAEKTIDEMETALRQIEDLAFKHIQDAAVRDQISEIVNSVWRGARS
jgi:predicted sugar kinase